MTGKNIFEYRFDNGDVKRIKTSSSLYNIAAMKAFALENVIKIKADYECPNINFKYDGHIIELWSPDVVKYYPPMFYGIAYNKCGSLVIFTINRDNNEQIE